MWTNLYFRWEFCTRMTSLMQKNSKWCHHLNKSLTRWQWQLLVFGRLISHMTRSLSAVALKSVASYFKTSSIDISQTNLKAVLILFSILLLNLNSWMQYLPKRKVTMDHLWMRLCKICTNLLKRAVFENCWTYGTYWHVFLPVAG